jgi:hypothetical protein
MKKLLLKRWNIEQINSKSINELMSDSKTISLNNYQMKVLKGGNGDEEEDSDIPLNDNSN